MRSHAFTLFTTAIGPCALVWGGQGIVGVQLPEASEAATRHRVLERFPEAQDTPPPAVIAQARDNIVALLGGARIDLSGVVLDMDFVPSFHRRVYEAARTIAPGTTVTYGALARVIGAEGAARAVGQALGRNPFPIVVPCHRVLAASGKLGGFSAHGGIETKRRLLEIEGAGPGAPQLFDDLAESARSRSTRRLEITGGRHAGGTDGFPPSR